MKKNLFKQNAFYLRCLGGLLFSSLLLIDLDSDPLWGNETPGASPPARPAVELGELKETGSTPEGEARLWKLSELIEEALANNPELRAYEERWRAAKARVWQAISWDDTGVGADFEGIPRGRIDADRRMNTEWMISQKIPFPGKRFLRGRVAHKEAKMAEADYRAKEREIVSEVKKAYFEYFLREHEIFLHKETKRILERLSKSAESRYATGQVPYHEVLRAHTELATITNDVAKHYQQREIARARLLALLGWETRGKSPASLQVSTAIPDHPSSYHREDLLKLALDHRQELLAMRYGLEAAKTDSKAAWLELLPDPEFRIEARNFRGESRFREYDQFVGFEIPILSLLKRAGEIREKRAESRASERAWENMKNLVLFEVEQALSEFEWNHRTVQTYETSVVPQAESTVQAALAEYESGKGNFLTVMEAEKALTEFRHEYFHSLAMREMSFAELERVVGLSLEGGILQ